MEESTYYLDKNIKTISKTSTVELKHKTNTDFQFVAKYQLFLQHIKTFQNILLKTI